MALHFEKAEFESRITRVVAEMTARGLSALLLFRQESMFYLTGYDSFGYVFFQSLVLTADGRLTLLTRAPDLRQARHTSIIEDIRIWVDGPDANPARDLRDLAGELGLDGGKLGVEHFPDSIRGFRINGTHVIFDRNILCVQGVDYLVILNIEFQR